MSDRDSRSLVYDRDSSSFVYGTCATCGAKIALVARISLADSVQVVTVEHNGPEGAFCAGSGQPLTQPFP